MSWGIVSLGDICEIINGGTPKSKVEEYWEGGIQWLTPKDMGKLDSRYADSSGRQISQAGLDNSSAKLIPENSVILSCRAPIGHLAINRVPMSFNQGCKGLVPKKDIEATYLFYFLLCNKEHLNDLGSGTTFKEISSKVLSKVKLPLPPLPVQKQIVEKLDAAFADIDKAISATEKNIENAEALFRQSLDKLFNSDHSKKYNLGDVCTFIGGSQPPKSKFELTKTEENIRLIQIRDYKSDKNIVYIPKELAKRHCKKDDVMIGRYGPPVFQILRGIEGSYNVALMKAEPDSNLLTKDYLFYFLKNPRIQNYIIFLSKRAAGQSGLNKQTIEPYPIPIPNLEEQDSIVSRTKSLEALTFKISYLNNRKLIELNSLKLSILSQTF